MLRTRKSGDRPVKSPPTVVMTPSQRAFVDAQIALSAWRAARDAEAQVAHWLTEGRATREELAHYRMRTRAAHALHSRARAAYRQAQLACEQGRGQGREPTQRGRGSASVRARNGE